MGTAILFGSGWSGGAVLAAFFIASNLVSRIGPKKASLRLDPKSDRRDLWQVFANGGAAAIAALAARSDTLGVWLVTASLAAATADTWATEIGTRSGRRPRLLGFGQPVPPGSNGGMTLAGTFGSAAGALIVAGTGALVTGIPSLLPAGTLIGFVGMTVDSILGAVFQGRFYCPACSQPSEWRIHRCGNPTTHRAGLEWLNNDGVNFLATALAAGLGLVCWWWLD